MSQKKWDSGLIARTIRNAYRKGQDVSYNAMARVNQGLISASNYYYGSYRKAVAAAGIDYAEIRRKPRWTRDRVVEAIQQAHRAKQDLSWAKVSHRRDELGCAAKAAIRERIFGNWNDALKKAGLDPEEVSRYRHWPPARIKKELKARAKRKEPLNSKMIQIDLPGLYGAAVRQFGTFEEALRQCGVDPDKITQRRVWDRPAVAAGLREFEKTFGIVSQAMLRRLDSGLMRAVRIWFGDLNAAVKYAKVKHYTTRGYRGRAGQMPFADAPGWRKTRAQGGTQVGKPKALRKKANSN